MLIHRIQVPSKKSIIFLDPSEISTLVADGNYTHVYLADKRRYYVSMQLNQLYNKLDKELFYRCHNSYVINLSHILEYIHEDGGYVLLTTNEKIPVSRQKKSDLFIRLGVNNIRFN